MSRTYNSRYRIKKAKYFNVTYPNGYTYKVPYGIIKIEENGTYKSDLSKTTFDKNYFRDNEKLTYHICRHPNKKKRRHTLNREWKGILCRYDYKDGRMGDCYERSDRQRLIKKGRRGIRRAKAKQKILNYESN